MKIVENLKLVELIPAEYQMKYRANFNVNNGTRLATELEGTNRWTLMHEIRERALGNVFLDAHASWYVDDENGKPVFRGEYIPKVGIRYSIYNGKQW